MAGPPSGLATNHVSKPGRRSRRTALVLAALVVVGVATFLIGRWSAPLGGGHSNSAPTIRATTTLALRPISLSLAVTGLVEPASQATLALIAPSGVARAIVTATPISVGHRLTAGAVIIELSGRPLFVLPGARPSYRDLSTGDSGADVTQLQKGLRAAGYPTQVTGTFDSQTGSSVSAMYAKHGYTAAGTRAKPVVPAAEIGYVPVLPAILSQVPVVVGDDPSGKALTVIPADHATAVGQLSPADSASAPTGTPVVMRCGSTSVSGVLGRPLPAAAPDPSSPTPPATTVNRRIDNNKTVLSASLVGAVCTGTATVQVVATPVLVAPVSALYTTADGSVVHAIVGGSEVAIHVDVGRSAGGWVELRAPDARLKAGTKVEIGQQP